MFFENLFQRITILVKNRDKYNYIIILITHKFTINLYKIYSYLEKIYHNK